MKVEAIEDILVKNNDQDNLNFLFINNLIKKEYKCEKCSNFMKLEKSRTFIDRFAWRCYQSKCINYKKRFSIRKNSFFEGLNIDVKRILQVLAMWATDEQQYITLKTIHLSKKSYKKIIDKVINLIRKYNEANIRKMGGPGNLVQVDETYMSHKCKKNNWESPTYKTDILTIAEYRDKISWTHAEIITNRNQDTILPIICKNIISGSSIHTDEYKYYSSLCVSGYSYESLCYKYKFVEKKEGDHIEAIQAFHNSLKQEIKKRKGVRREDRSVFLLEFVWKFNNRHNRFKNLLNLIKV